MALDTLADNFQSKEGERTVWVLARPINAARGFSFLSDGKFPLCHWAVLLSNLNEVRFKVLWDSKTNIGLNGSWGTLFELFRDDNDKNIPHEIYDFGSHDEFLNDWKSVAIIFIGTSLRSDSEVSAQGC